MRDRTILKKSGLTVLIALLLLSLGWITHPLTKVVATGLPPVAQPALIYGAPGVDYVADQIIVKFKAGINVVSEKQLNDTAGTGIVFSSRGIGFKVLKIPQGKTVAEMVAAYSAQPIVEYAEPNYIAHITFTPNDPGYSYQWNFTQINMGSAWDLDTTSPNYGGDSSIVVAVIDTGVAYETYSGFVKAPDLANTNFTSGYDFVNNDAHPNDDNSHGTHVCGTIAQSTNNGVGVAGIAFNTTIMPIKAFASDGNGNTANIAAAYEYAADNGAHIINYSAGGPASDTLLEAVAYARNAGVIIIAAMGNKGDTTNTTEYPAAYNDYVVAVGATDYNQARSYYSSYGAHCDIAAPGGDTTVNHSGNGNDGILQNTFNPNTKDPTVFSYWFFDGTSMATPHVSGVAALIKAKHPTWNAAQVRHALESTTTDKGTAGKDNEYGWGLIHAANAVGASLPTAASYADTDGNTVPDTPTETFDNYATEHVVYIVNTGLLPTYNYRVAYYDSGNNKRDTQNDTSSASGNLLTHHTFVPVTDAAGTWRVIVCDQAHTPPATYSSTWKYTIQEDTFTVMDSAIPEFPSVLAAIVSLSLCAGVYLWMRRKRAPMPA